MTDFESRLRRYRREIRRLIPVKTGAAKRFLEDLEGNVRDFAEAEGISDFALVESRFGAPEAVAKAFLASADLRDVRKKVAVKNAVLAVLLAALLVWGAAVCALWLQAKKDLNGYYEVSGGVVVPANGEGAEVK